MVAINFVSRDFGIVLIISVIFVDGCKLCNFPNVAIAEDVVAVAVADDLAIAATVVTPNHTLVLKRNGNAHCLVWLNEQTYNFSLLFVQHFMLLIKFN